MAHNINYNEQNGKHSFFSVKEKAWHGLGQIISDYPTSAEALQYANLDYQVEKRPVFTYGDDTNWDSDADMIMEWQITLPNYFATVRTDTEKPLGVVGKDYEIVQNVDAFSFFDSIVGGKDGILYETAGALGNGERIFITAKLPDHIKVGRKDCIEKYLFLTTSHDGTGSITIAFTPVRVICQNTLNAALNNHVNCIKIRHTASATDKLKQAHKMLGITNQLSVELEAVFNRWSRVRITDPELKKLIQLGMIPNRETYEKLKAGKNDELSSHFNNVVSSVFDYAMTNPTQQVDTTKGTLFGAYNTVTGYFQNVRNFKDEESKFKSIMYGTGLQKNQTTFNLCVDFAKHGNRVLNFN
jgi:phage/plasmid-like protein (TIGR03299 family)